MSGRHVLALTNSEKAAGAIQRAALDDFPTSTERRVTFVDGYGWCIEISVDADEFQQWVTT